jgi:polyisoprenoid-binding protein YceI
VRARTLLALAIAFMVLAAFAWAATWRIDPEKSRLGFTGLQVGTPFEGRFERFSTDIRFDEGDLAASSARVVIDLASARTGNDQRDEALLGQDWFAVARFPQARFETTGFRHLEDNRYEVDATLTIRDVARPVVLPFTLERDGPATRAIGELTINRIDFGVGQGQWASPQWVALDVTIHFDLLAQPGP